MDFETYWREFGKLEQEVIKNRPELEEDFKKLAEKIWIISYESAEKDYDKGYDDGYDDAGKNFKCDCCG